MRSTSFQRINQQKSLDDSPERGETGIDRKNVWTGEENPSAEQQFVRQEMNECISDFIGRLPENYRTVLVLGELEGFKNKEIAEILGVSLNTVKIRLHRAMEKLKQELWQHCEAYWVEDNEFVPDLKEALEEYRKTA
jgi:RNA polymerase sigma-70 factor (ECF subfamily)